MFITKVICYFIFLTDDWFLFKDGTEIKAIPHKACAEDALSDFSSDCIEIPQAYYRMSRDFCAR